MKYIKNTYLFFRWLWWNIWYKIRPHHRYFIKELQLWDRCRWPWYKWEPYVWHNKYGNMWCVYFSDDLDYSARMTITINADINFSRETGKITAIDLFDKELRKIEELNRGNV